MDPRRTTISAYTWGVLAAGALLILGSIWWASMSGTAAPKGMVYAEAPDERPLHSTAIRQAATPARLGTLPDLSSGIEPYAKAAPSVKVMPAHKAPPVRKAKQPGSMFSDMFPVGSITANAPQLAHPYMKVPELFPSFFYDKKMWLPTGRFARSDEVELAPIGREVTGRNVYALRNTASPSAALFVQSERDPNKYAIYR